MLQVRIITHTHENTILFLQQRKQQNVSDKKDVLRDSRFFWKCYNKDGSKNNAFYWDIVPANIPYLCLLTHWGRDKKTAISHTTFSNAFSWMKMYEFRLSRSGDKPLSEPMMVTLLTHVCVTRPRWVKSMLRTWFVMFLPMRENYVGSYPDNKHRRIDID